MDASPPEAADVPTRTIVAHRRLILQL